MFPCLKSLNCIFPVSLSNNICNDMLSMSNQDMHFAKITGMCAQSPFVFFYPVIRSFSDINFRRKMNVYYELVQFLFSWMSNLPRFQQRRFEELFGQMEGLHLPLSVSVPSEHRSHVSLGNSENSI